jgi:hypothetical protein
MTATEMTEYWQGLAKKAGLSDEQTQAVTASLSDETVAKTFTDGFRSAPEYNKGLDKNRTDYDGKVAEANDRATKLESWYETEARPAYEQNRQGTATLQKYQELYGALDGEPDPKPAPKPEVNAVTREEFDKAMQQRGHETVDFVTEATLAGGDYAHRFKKPMSRDQIKEITKLAGDKGIPYGDAYDMWVGPDIRKLEVDALEAKHKKDTEEAVRDALSAHNLPVDPKQAEFHPFNNPGTVEGKPTSVEAQERSKSAFLTAWSEAAPTTG